MPLSKHTVQPVKISQVHVPDGVDNELEYVTNATVCNVMLQIASIGKLASNMFEELATDLSKLTQRTHNLQNRLGKLHENVQLMRTGDEDLTANVQFALAHPFVSHKPADSQVLNQNTIPPSMRSRYNQADPPPALSELDVLRDDQKTSMVLYSDPSFFFELWSRGMLYDYNKHKRNMRKKPKQKAKQNVAAKSDRPPLKSPLVIQQSGVGGCANPPWTASPEFKRNGSVSDQLPSNNTLPPPPPPPPPAPIGYTDELTNQHAVNGTVVNGYGMNGTTTLPKAVQLPVNYPPPPLPPPAFMNDRELGMAGLQREIDALDINSIHDHMADEACMPVPPTFGSMPDSYLKVAPRSNSPENSSIHSHDLPPPPAPMFDNKINLNSAGNNDASINPPIPPPPPPAMMSSTKPSQVTPPAIIPPPPPPPPPPPSQLSGPTHSIHSNGPPSVVASSKPPLTKPVDTRDDLMSAIRAGMKLRKASDRQLPNSVLKPLNNGNTTNVNGLPSKPKDVQAIYEALRRRRECMENNSSNDDDDDKDGNSESSGWDD